MTLVVGIVDEAGPKLWADSRLSSPDSTPHYLNGALKLLILEPNLCVGFAGSYRAAVAAIRDAAAGRRPLSPSDLTARLAEEDRCDFLVGTLHPSRLFRVRRAVVEPGRDLWIGDIEGFGRFQEFRHTAPPSAGEYPELAAAIACGHAMHRLVSDASVATVGEIVVSVIPQAAGFMYADTAVITAGPQTIPSRVPTTMTFGSAARGDFGYTVLCPREPAPLVGVYFFEGALGMLFAPLRSEDPILIRHTSQDAFERQVAAEFGVEIGGISLS